MPPSYTALKRCLLSYHNLPRTLEVPQICCGPHTLPICSPLVRPVGSHTSIYEMHGGSGGLPEEARGENLPISGQLAGQSSVQSSGGVQHSPYSVVFPNLRPANNVEKSIFIPVQRIKFIREVFNSSQARAFLPEGHFQAITALQGHPVATVRSCLRLQGHMASCIYVIQYARLYLRPL